jgi:hypothetical protein
MFKGIEMDAMKAKEFFEKAVDKDLRFKKFFEKSVEELEPTIMAWIVDAWLENFMRKEGLSSLTKVKGDNVMKRVYEKP